MEQEVSQLKNEITELKKEKEQEKAAWEMTVREASARTHELEGIVVTLKEEVESRRLLQTKGRLLQFINAVSIIWNAAHHHHKQMSVLDIFSKWKLICILSAWKEKHDGLISTHKDLLQLSGHIVPHHHRHSVDTEGSEGCEEDFHPSIPFHLDSDLEEDNEGEFQYEGLHVPYDGV